METFAKIVELPETQVLYFIDYDDEEDATRLHQILDVDGFRADMALLFTGTNQEEQARAALENVDEEASRMVLEHVRQVMQP